jgi:hypothetical protein
MSVVRYPNYDGKYHRWPLEMIILIKFNQIFEKFYLPLSTMKAQSECSSVVCVVRIELYGSTTAVEI